LVTELHKQEHQFAQAAVDIPDDVERAVLDTLVHRQRVALEADRVHFFFRVQHIHTAEAFFFQPAQ
jgi:hypothetical protein